MRKDLERRSDAALRRLDGTATHGREAIRASLVVADGDAAGECFHIGRRTFVVGRGECCTVQVLDRRASRKHCRIRWDEHASRHVVADVGSLNGTKLNDEQAAGERTLRDGDVITVGRTRLVYFEERFLDGAVALLRWRQVGERALPTLPPTAA